jgi:nucleoside-diphosphate-sugar epimerase
MSPVPHLPWRGRAESPVGRGTGPGTVIGMKVLITGGSGYIGRHIVRELVARGDEVHALARTDETARVIEDAGAAPLRGDGTYVGDGTYRTPLVHVQDIARLFVLALGAPAGSRFIGSTESVPAIEIAQAVADGRARSETLEEAEARLGPLADAMALDQELSSARAREQLGWAPEHTNARAELRSG